MYRRRRVSKPKKAAVEVDREHWRVQARAAFKALGRGSKARCSRELRISQSQITGILNGRIKGSPWAYSIADWLKISPPILGLSAKGAELVSLVERMTPSQQEAMLAVANEITGQKKN